MNELWRFFVRNKLLLIVNLEYECRWCLLDAMLIYEFDCVIINLSIYKDCITMPYE